MGTPDQPGIIPRALEYMFRSLPQLPAVPEFKPLPHGGVEFITKGRYDLLEQRKHAILSATKNGPHSLLETYK